MFFPLSYFFVSHIGRNSGASLPASSHFCCIITILPRNPFSHCPAISELMSRRPHAAALLRLYLHELMPRCPYVAALLRLYLHELMPRRPHVAAILQLHYTSSCLGALMRQPPLCDYPFYALMRQPFHGYISCHFTAL
ncbi:hypothetical protein B0H17DRAFT_1064798 [Mycena rosella]|uniref:Uncharacterized protein n=1 Tax=Mycena rosella TaxID=1033263 RepID=A0AAD7DG74_MYCRO|nr:hypothetical protein B0H17DRAFT_1101226 [Mycena rosella]KAJ7690474.1 hypothetical protein B0H17DRAFT_1064798 [Mycena rosella]